MRLDDQIHWRDEVEVTSLLNEGKFYLITHKFQSKLAGG